MRRLWFGILLGLLGLAIGFATALYSRTASRGRPILFVFDASGSMAESLGGVQRIVAARFLLLEQIRKFGRETPVGLVAYGNRIPGCNSVRIYAPIRTGNQNTLEEQVGKFYPAGSTPIARSLRLIADNLLPEYPGTTVVLISDGAESCGGDPVAEARKLVERGVDLRLNVIGLAVDDAATRELQAVASAGRGRYFAVETHADLEAAIRQSVENTPESGPAVAESSRVVQRAERLWDLDHDADDHPIAGPSSAAQTVARQPFEIVRLRPAGTDASGATLFEVEYRFFHQRPGDFMVSLMALERPVAPGPGGRIVADDNLIAMSNASYYRVKAGSGTLLLRLPADRPGFVVQGELWETSNVPEHLYISNYLPAP